MKKILIVDDIEANRMLLGKILLATNDCVIIEAANGEDAIVQYKKEDPDIILMDINMPDMNGCQAAAAIKSIASDDYTPIIFVTALTDELSFTDALDSGGDDLISKPFSVEVLSSKINAHMRIRELNQQLTRRNRHLIHEQELIEHFFEKALQKCFLDERIIKYHMSSMATFNGDLFLVDRGPQGGLSLLMGDFTGHGLTAAMGSLPVAMIFFKMVKKGVSIGDIAREINRQLHELMPSGLFFSATLLELNTHGDILSAWMGGMPECYRISKRGELKGMIHAHHMPLGILEESEFNDTTETFNVEEGDKVYLYSDGVTEARSPDGEMFGNDRLKEMLVTGGENCFEHILEELEMFTGTQDQNDDIALVEMTCCCISALENSDEVEEVNDERSILS